MFYITIRKHAPDGAMSASDPGDFDAAVDAYAEHRDDPGNRYFGATVYRCEPLAGVMADVTEDAHKRLWERFRQRGWTDSIPAWLADEVAA